MNSQVSFLKVSTKVCIEIDFTQENIKDFTLSLQEDNGKRQVKFGAAKKPKIDLSSFSKKNAGARKDPRKSKEKSMKPGKKSHYPAV